MKKYIFMMILAMGLYAETTDPMFVEDNLVEEIVEDDFFGNAFETGTIEDLTMDINKESISFTGDFKTNGAFVDYDGKASTLNANIESNVDIDVRLKEGVKAYTSLNLSKTNDDTANPEFLKLNEMFFDFNINDKVYVRSGKQNLAWGRGYFFNPTDLINIEKKKLDDVSGQREGNLGIKVHVPSGFARNFYAYLQLEDKTLLSEGSLALKYEFLVKNSEFSLATIIRNPDSYSPLLAFDFASSIGKAQTFGEFILQNGDKLTYYENGVDVKLKDKLVLQGTVGYSRTFDKIDKDEDGKSISLIQEFYYNGAGYEDGYRQFPNPKLYNAYTDGKNYLVTFLAFNKFINDDTTLGINLLNGFSDNASQLTASYKYKLKDAVTLGSSIQGYFSSNTSGSSSSPFPRAVASFSAEIEF